MKNHMGLFSEARKLRDGITQLRVFGAVDVHFKRGEPSLSVFASTPERIKNVSTKLYGDTLEVSSTSEHGISIGHVNGNLIIHGGGRVSIQSVCGDVVISPKKSKRNVSLGPDIVRVELSLPVLDHVELSGASNVSLVDVRQEQLGLSISGAGKIDVAGSVDDFSVFLSGAGGVFASALKSKRAVLEVSGAGNIEAFVEKSALVTISGAGNAVIHGQPPRRSTHVSGVGSVRFC